MGKMLFTSILERLVARHRVCGERRAAMQETGLPAWAALSANGLRVLDLPMLVRDVVVLADGDDSGELAARDCAVRLIRNGHRVRIARPPKGMDFNDLLIDRVSLIKEGRNELR